MNLVNKIYVGPGETGGRFLTLIVSETDPSTLTITGADVEGMNDTDILAAGSVILTPAKTYVAFSDGTFTERG